MDKVDRVYTIVINWCGAPIKYRIKYLPIAFLLALKSTRELIKEYRDWNNRGFFPKQRHKFLYILDHFVLWQLYCVLAVFKGKVHGFSWVIKV